MGLVVILLGSRWRLLIGSIIINLHLHLYLLSLLPFQERLFPLRYHCSDLEVSWMLNLGFVPLNFDSLHLLGCHSIIVKIQLDLDFACGLLLLNNGQCFYIGIHVLGSILYAYLWYKLDRSMRIYPASISPLGC